MWGQRNPAELVAVPPSPSWVWGHCVGWSIPWHKLGQPCMCLQKREVWNGGSWNLVCFCALKEFSPTYAYYLKFGIYGCSIAGSEDGLMVAFLAPLLGSVLCKARLHIYPVLPAAKTRLHQWLSLQYWYRGREDVFWAFNIKIMMFLVEIPELLALVMTLAAVLLEQLGLGWKGYGKASEWNLHYCTDDLSLPIPSLLPRVWCLSYYIAKIEMPSVLKHFATSEVS